MEDQSWPDLPCQIIKQVFELQLNPLDNCAAACTCNSWHDAVQAAYVQTLHLHLDSSKIAKLMDGDYSAAKAWASLMASRFSVGLLQLTAASVEPSHAPSLAHILSATRYKGSLECSSLYLSEVFSPAADLYTGQLPRLARLSISYIMGSHSQSVLSSELALLSNLRNLTQLKTLDLDISLSEMREYGSTIQCTLPVVPESLEDLHNSFQCWTNRDAQFCWSQPSSVLNCAIHLTCLELVNCTLGISEGVLTCLQQLSSFSVAHSRVKCVDQVERLTHLTCLDLTCCCW